MKLTLHFQDQISETPLIRIDFGADHTNPQFVNGMVPIDLAAHKGRSFSISEPHIHYYVEGYQAKWAKPLSETGFPIVIIKDLSDVKPAILAMAQLINLLTQLSITIEDLAV